VSGETPTQTRIRECIDSFDHSIGWNDACQSELARLRAEAEKVKELEEFINNQIAMNGQRFAESEAWRAVRDAWEHDKDFMLTNIEFELQIARLDQLAAPTPTGGE
jgi:hypothetical protein